MLGLSWITGGAIGASLLVGAIGWGVALYKDNQYDKLVTESAEKIAVLKTNNDTLNSSLNTSNATIGQLLKDRANDAKILDDQSKERAMDRKELADLRREYESYKDRWTNVATKKPGLLANRANAATDRVVRGRETATCRADCDADKGS